MAEEENEPCPAGSPHRTRAAEDRHSMNGCDQHLLRDDVAR